MADPFWHENSCLGTKPIFLYSTWCRTVFLRHWLCEECQVFVGPFWTGWVELEIWWKELLLVFHPALMGMCLKKSQRLTWSSSKMKLHPLHRKKGSQFQTLRDCCGRSLVLMLFSNLFVFGMCWPPLAVECWDLAFIGLTVSRAAMRCSRFMAADGRWGTETHLRPVPVPTCSHYKQTTEMQGFQLCQKGEGHHVSNTQAVRFQHCQTTSRSQQSSVKLSFSDRPLKKH